MEDEDGEGDGAEEMDREGGGGGQRAASGESSPAALRRGAEIHHRRRNHVQVKEGESEERAEG